MENIANQDKLLEASKYSLEYSNNENGNVSENVNE